MNDDPLCDCGNLSFNAPDALGSSGHMMSCQRYRQVVYGEEPDPIKEIVKLRKRIVWLESENSAMKSKIRRFENGSREERAGSDVDGSREGKDE